jgi:hypothetical protein
MLFVAFAISCAQSFYFCYERVERLTEGRMDEELPTGFGFVRPGHSVTSTGSPTSSRTFVPFVSSRAFLIRVPTSGLTRSGVREMSAERKLKNAAMTGSALSFDRRLAYHRDKHGSRPDDMSMDLALLPEFRMRFKQCLFQADGLGLAGGRDSAPRRLHYARVPA